MDICSQNRGFNIGDVLLIVSYFIMLLGALLSTKRYTIEDDSICFHSFMQARCIKIDDIACIKETWVAGNNGNSNAYQIVLSDDAEKPITIDLSLLNENGKMLLSVLEDQYNIKFHQI